MAKRIWRPLNSYGLLFIGFCVGVTLTTTIALL